MRALGVVAMLVVSAGCTRTPNDRSAPAPTPLAAADAGPNPNPSPSPSPTEVAVNDAEPPPAEAFTGVATPKNPSDLAWLTELVRTLAARKVTREQVIAYLGSDAGASPINSSRRRVRPHSPYLASAEVYALSHVRIEVAVDIELAANARPNRSAIEKAVGALTPMPRNPDDFSSGPRLAHYEEGAHATARVFVELDAKDPTRVAKIHVDADGAKD